VTFSPQFEHIWIESKKRLPEHVSQKPANLELRSQYSIRFYDWAKKYVDARTKTISLEELRRVLGIESVKDVEGNIINEVPMPIWANFRQRALARCRNSGDQREDGLEDQARVHRMIKTPPSCRIGFCNCRRSNQNQPVRVESKPATFIL
jgi:hypothetical protein